MRTMELNVTTTQERSTAVGESNPQAEPLESREPTILVEQTLSAPTPAVTEPDAAPQPAILVEPVAESAPPADPDGSEPLSRSTTGVAEATEPAPCPVTSDADGEEGAPDYDPNDETVLSVRDAISRREAEARGDDDGH